jgi:hypothetical protein
MDLAEIHSSAGKSLCTLIGRGDGSFEDARCLDARQMHEDLELCELRGGGRLDIVLLASSNMAGESKLRLFANLGGGEFTAAGEWPAHYLPSSLACADADGDGHPDVAFLDSKGMDVAVLLGDGRGGLAAPRWFALPSYGLALAVGEVSGDGRNDLLVAAPGSPLLILENTSRRTPASGAALNGWR